jgi:hypothetical protein
MLGILSPTIKFILGGRSSTSQNIEQEQSELDDDFSEVAFNISHILDGKDTKKKILLNLYRGTYLEVDQQNDLRKRIVCSSIISIAKHDSETLIIRQQVDSDAFVEKHRIYRFNNQADAELFKKYIFGCNDFGNYMRLLFDSIGSKASGLISSHALKAALIKEGLPSSDKDIVKMLSIQGGNGSSIDFDSIFRF